MSTMDELIATLNGGIHVSQENYDLKALQEYLAQNLALPQLVPLSPTTQYRQMPSSRSTSVTRKSSSLPSTYPYSDAPTEYYPSTIHETPYAGSDDTVVTPNPHPSVLRRTSSYGFGFGQHAPATSPGLHGFESDAFAPLWHQPPSSDPWVTIRQGEKQNPWAAFQGQSAFFKPQQAVQVQVQVQEVRKESLDQDGGQGMDEDENEDDAMDEDEDAVEVEMGDGEEEERWEDHDQKGWDRFRQNEGQNPWERGRRSA